MVNRDMANTSDVLGNRKRVSNGPSTDKAPFPLYVQGKNNKERGSE